MRLEKRLALIFFVILQFAASLLLAQDQSTGDVRQVEPGRPKLGLVLSGGGARGLAHIGVLEWFEEHRIPVDYLGGTSMGGLVGGMYATGMSPKEMRAFINTIDWVQAFGTGIPYVDLSFRRKEDRRAYPVELELGLKHGLSLPPGLSTGIEINLLIDRITLPYSTTLTFDKLPIPFFCVGTDILNAKEVVMKDGLLSSAMRATMSLPGIFPPVRRDGLWLVDGGVLNNIPVDVMRTENPDVVVAVNVGTPLGDEKSIQSLLGVASQAIGVFMVGNEQKNLKLADIVISPDLGKVTTTNFENIDATADLGYAAAQKVASQLLKYQMSPEDWKKYTAIRTARKQINLPVPTAVLVRGVAEDATQNIQKEFQVYAGHVVDINQLEKGLVRLCGEGRYQAADYGFVIDDKQQPVLELRITEKTYAPPTLNFALTLQGSDISDFNFGFGTRLTVFDIGRYGTEWRNDFNVGFNSNFATEFYRPFGMSGMMSKVGLYKRGYFMAPRAFYERGKREFFSGGERQAEYEVNNYGFGFDFGYGTWRSELRFGGQIEHLDANLSTGTAPIDSLSGAVTFGRVRWAFDGTDSATIPHTGMRFFSEARYYWDSPMKVEQFPWALLQDTWFKPVGKRGTFFAAGRLGTTFDKEAAPAQKFALGGPFNLGAFDAGEFTGNNELLASTGYYHAIFDLPAVFGQSVYLMGWYDIGSAFNDWDNIDFKNQGSFGVTADTRLGPFALVFAYGQGGASNVYFTFGRFF